MLRAYQSEGKLPSSDVIESFATQAHLCARLEFLGTASLLPCIGTQSYLCIVCMFVVQYALFRRNIQHALTDMKLEANIKRATDAASLLPSLFNNVPQWYVVVSDSIHVYSQPFN